MCWFRKKKSPVEKTEKINEYKFVQEENIAGNTVYWYTEINGNYLQGTARYDKDKALEIFNRIKERNISSTTIKKYIDPNV